MVCAAALRCDKEHQPTLLSNVVCVGGGACFGGIVDRLHTTIEDRVHAYAPGWRVRVLTPEPAHRRACSWIGGSLIAALPSMRDKWVTKAEWLEGGAEALDKKFA
jgi:actin-related protein